MPVKKDLTGQKFGRLFVEYDLKERKYGKIVWHCICDCGAEKDILGSQLTKTNNPTQSCGCLQKENTRKANQEKGLEYQTFGRLTVLSRNLKGDKWICQCVCGNQIEVPTNHLKQGHTQSCGCLQKDKAKEKVVDITGNKYGLLTVIERNYDIDDGITRWLCQCDCGKRIVVKKGHLISGDTQSCGCLKFSHGELKIRQLLDEANILYQTEYMFDTCRNPLTNKPLRFDFYVNNKYLIEYDGKQHYEDGNWEPLKDIQYRDNIKNQWCKDNNIPLIRIPYTKLKTLALEDLIL